MMYPVSGRSGGCEGVWWRIQRGVGAELMGWPWVLTRCLGMMGVLVWCLIWGLAGDVLFCERCSDAGVV